MWGLWWVVVFPTGQPIISETAHWLSKWCYHMISIFYFQWRIINLSYHLKMLIAMITYLKSSFETYRSVNIYFIIIHIYISILYNNKIILETALQNSRFMNFHIILIASEYNSNYLSRGLIELVRELSQTDSICYSLAFK